MHKGPGVKGHMHKGPGVKGHMHKGPGLIKGHMHNSLETLTFCVQVWLSNNWQSDKKSKGMCYSRKSLIRTSAIWIFTYPNSKIMTFIAILLYIKWKVLSFAYYQYCTTYPNISVIWTPSGPNVFG